MWRGKEVIGLGIGKPVLCHYGDFCSLQEINVKFFTFLFSEILWFFKLLPTKTIIMGYS